MALKTRRFDASEYLNSDEAVASYLEAVLEIGDPKLITAALGDIARARGMTQIAKETGLSRESLYRALTEDANPEFGTITKVLGALGLRLSVQPAQAAEKKPAAKPAAPKRRRKAA